MDRINTLGAGIQDRAMEVEGTLAERLFHQLTEAILMGEIPLGSKISEPALAQRFGVSRGPLREAMHRLQERRLITRTANQGARVTEATPERLSSLFSVREMLEGLAAREAAFKMTSEDFLKLRETIEHHEAGLAGLEPGQHNALGTVDRDFHFQIAQSSQNDLLIKLLCEELYPLLRLYRSRNDSLVLRQRAVVEHKRIYDAITDRDADLAEIMMRRHIGSAKIRRVEAMQRDMPFEEAAPLSAGKRKAKPRTS
ncbi:GntR family transcriptional regulator [Agrobacterium vaccinii]|uniref:GntR family transcriptional regulator n=1 Tax=Agrobacterium vaccinii TaxID=2735528 RepID=UPI001E3EB032|nr:GntR family transcriptional regulator [Agrobacterium vaccinii]